MCLPVYIYICVCVCVCHQNALVSKGLSSPKVDVNNGCSGVDGDSDSLMGVGRTMSGVLRTNSYINSIKTGKYIQDPVHGHVWLEPELIRVHTLRICILYLNVSGCTWLQTRPGVWVPSACVRICVYVPVCMLVLDH